MTPVTTKNVTLNENGKVAMRVIRIDAPVNSGNSGGGLYNANGELIGIVNAKMIISDVENIGYAIPSTLATNVADNIIQNCDGEENVYVKKCLMGVTIKVNSTAACFDEKTNTTYLKEEIIVMDVASGSVAYNKLFVDDIIKSITINGFTYEVTRNFILVEACLKAKPGDVATMKVLRNGLEVTVSITFGDSTIIG